MANRCSMQLHLLGIFYGLYRCFLCLRLPLLSLCMRVHLLTYLSFVQIASSSWAFQSQVARFYLFLGSVLYSRVQLSVVWWLSYVWHCQGISRVDWDFELLDRSHFFDASSGWKNMLCFLCYGLLICLPNLCRLTLSFFPGASAVCGECLLEPQSSFVSRLLTFS